MNPIGVQPWPVQSLPVNPLRKGFKRVKTSLNLGFEVLEEVLGLVSYVWLANHLRLNSSKPYGFVELVCSYSVSSDL